MATIPSFRPSNHMVIKCNLFLVGRFTDKKAAHCTILALNAALKKFPNAKLLMVGDGTLLNKCKNLVKHLKIDKNVIFSGVISPNEFKEHLSKSLDFIQHSITADDGNMEGTSVVILKAIVQQVYR